MPRIHIYICLFLTTTPSVMTQKAAPRTTQMMERFMRETLINLERDFNNTDSIRQFSYLTPAFEIGFVIKTMEEGYRRMVDIYNSTLTTDLRNPDVPTTDPIMLLKSVENYFLVIEHLSRMLHEIERKYKLKKAGMFEKHPDFTLRTPTPTQRRRSTANPFSFSVPTTTTRRRQSWKRLDYGWDNVNYDWK